MFRHKRLMLIFFGVLCLFMVFYAVTRITENYRLDKMVGQMIVVGFRGTVPTDPTVQALSDDIATGQIGGVILYSVDQKMSADAGVSDALSQRLTKTRNIVSVPQIAKLNKFLADTAHANDNPPLLIAIRQAGGAQTQLKPEHGFGYVVPAARGTADALTTDQARQVYTGLGERLSDVGINLNLAPALDLDSTQGYAFSSDPDTVVKYAGAMANAMTDSGILYALNSFPGNGSADAYRPYAQLAHSNMPGLVMMASTMNPEIDDQLPATLSKKTITDILRDQMEYNGVVMSADLTTVAMSQTELAEKLRLAILAGNDILLLGNNETYVPNIGRTAHDEIVQMVKQGQIPRSKIHHSYRRIMRLKSNLK